MKKAATFDFDSKKIVCLEWCWSNRAKGVRPYGQYISLSQSDNLLCKIVTSRGKKDFIIKKSFTSFRDVLCQMSLGISTDLDKTVFM